jgi:hypothetical protein
MVRQAGVGIIPIYQWIELQHAALQPIRMMARTAQALFRAPLNPVSYTAWGRVGGRRLRNVRACYPPLRQARLAHQKYPRPWRRDCRCARDGVGASVSQTRAFRTCDRLALSPAKTLPAAASALVALLRARPLTGVFQTELVYTHYPGCRRSPGREPRGAACHQLILMCG